MPGEEALGDGQNLRYESIAIWRMVVCKCTLVYCQLLVAIDFLLSLPGCIAPSSHSSVRCWAGRHRRRHVCNLVCTCFRSFRSFNYSSRTVKCISTIPICGDPLTVSEVDSLREIDPGVISTARSGSQHCRGFSFDLTVLVTSPRRFSTAIRSRGASQGSKVPSIWNDLLTLHLAYSVSALSRSCCFGRETR